MVLFARIVIAIRDVNGKRLWVCRYCRLRKQKKTQYNLLYPVYGGKIC